MKTFELSDGTSVEITMADSCSGPGCCFGGQHCNHVVSFYRVNEGEWKRATTRSLHKTREAVLMCETIEDVREMLDFEAQQPPM